MLRKRSIVFFITAFWMACLPLVAQDDEEPEHINSHLGFTMSAPLNPTSQVVNSGIGVSAGAGYNFNSRHAIVGDFMWNHLTVTNEALAPIRAALQTADVNGSGNLFALTTNYRFELPHRGVSTYFIGGGGLYHRNAGVNRPIQTGTTISCLPGWRLFGFNCATGTTITDQTIVSSSSNTFGVNGGIGFTVHVGEPSYRFYVEARYHFAPSPGINTQIVAVTVGIRY